MTDTAIGKVFQQTLRQKVTKVIDCPVCNNHEFKISDHKGRYRWHCNGCFSNLVIFIKDDDSVSIEVIEPDWFDTYRLLQVDSEITKKEVYIVVRGGARSKSTEDDPHFDHDEKYYVEEHTCPTNLVGGMDVFFAVQAPGEQYWDTDPHGIFKHVVTKSVDEVHTALGIEDDSNLQSHENEAILKYLLDGTVTNLSGT